MFILNKKKYFDKIMHTLFNNDMKIINTINELLTTYGAKPHIENDKESFVTITFLHILFLQEGLLQRKYYPKYKYEVSALLDTMIYEMADRCNYQPSKLRDFYLNLRRTLDQMSLETENNIDLYYAYAVAYVYDTFDEESKPEELGYEVGEVEEALAKVFQYVMIDSADYINSL